MHFSFPFTVSQVLWTLTFAAQLVLLVVLLGRDRIQRFPWFTASIALFALRLLAEVLLTGRMAPTVLRVVFLSMADVAALVGLLVVVEMARRAFGAASLRTWIVGVLALVAVGVGVLYAWGPWPAWKALTADPQLTTLRLMQLGAQKADLLMDVLTVELGLLVVLFGRLFKAGWHSHVQRIVIGLSTVALSWLAVQGVWQVIAATVHPHTPEEYERIVGLGAKMVNANKVVYLAVLIWWIACLWRDEPGAKARGTLVDEAEPGPLRTPEAAAAEEIFTEMSYYPTGSNGHPA
jgi:hypothetical protein